MAVTPLQVSEAFGRVAQASSVEAANILLGDELAPLFNQGASGEGFSEFESPVGDPIQIDLSFPLVTISTRDSGVVPGTYGSSAEIPFFTVDVFGRVTEAGSFSLSSLPASGPASGDLSGTYPSPTVTGLRGHVLPAVNGTPGNLRWDGIGWALDFQPYALSGHTHPYLPIDNPTFTGTMSGPALKLSDAGVGVGILSWSSQEHTAELTLENGSVLQIGKESLQWCKDGTGAGLTHGQLVYVSGSTGDSPVVRLADADDPAAYETIGMVTQPIAPNGEGFVATSISFVRGLNLSGYTVGQAVYLSTTPGGFVATAPSKPGRRIRVGFVLRAHAVQGIILLWVDRPGALRDLDDVDTSGAILGNALTISADGVWRPTAVLPAANPTFTGTLTGPSIRVTGLSNSFVKSDASGSLVNGTISVSDLPSHTHAYLPISNPTFTGRLSGNDVKIGGGTTSGWLQLIANNTGSGTLNVDFLGGASSNRRMTFRWSDSLDNLNIMTSNDDGSARLDRVLIPRSSALPIAVAGGFNVSTGDLSVGGVAISDSSRNGSFAGLTASGTLKAASTVSATSFQWAPNAAEGVSFFGSTSSANDGAGYHSLVLHSNDSEAAGRSLGNVTFGQKVSGKSGSYPGLKAFIRGETYGSGGSVGGFGGRVLIVARGDNESLPSDIASFDKTKVVLATGIPLYQGATERVTAGGDGRFSSLRASSLSAAAVRPATIGTDGTLGTQDPATFLTTIGAASASHTHPYLPISNPAFTGLLTGPDISLSGALIASQVYTSSNGSGSNVKIGDDLLIGDINQANTVGLSGAQNSTIAHIRFGSSGPTFGYNGTSFIMSNMAGSGTRFLVVGASGDISNLVYNGPWLPLSGAARVSGWVAFDAVVYPTATVNFSGYTLSQFGLYAHTAFTFSGGGITFEDTVLFSGSVSFDAAPTFTRSLTLPFVGYTAILGDLGSNIYPIPVASATVYLASGSSSSYRNYSAPYLADGQIIVIHGKPYGAPINAPQLYASSGCTIYDARGIAVADDTSPLPVNGVIIAQCYGGDLYILNRGDTAL